MAHAIFVLSCFLGSLWNIKRNNWDWDCCLMITPSIQPCALTKQHKGVGDPCVVHTSWMPLSWSWLSIWTSRSGKEKVVGQKCRNGEVNIYLTPAHKQILGSLLNSINMVFFLKGWVMKWAEQWKERLNPKLILSHSPIPFHCCLIYCISCLSPFKNTHLKLHIFFICTILKCL